MSQQIDRSAVVSQSSFDSKTRTELPTISIPRGLRAGLVALDGLSDECYRFLTESLTSASTTETPKSMAEKIAASFPDSSEAGIVHIINSISSSQEVQKTSHVPVAEFAGDVWDALRRDAPDAAAKMDESRFKNRFIALIGQPDIQLVTSKAERLKHDAERTMIDARIITDIRSIFSQDASTPPRTMVIVHTLQMRYHDSAEEHRSIYIALDDNDLEMLGEAVERAKTKKKTLASLLESANLPVVK